MDLGTVTISWTCFILPRKGWSSKGQGNSGKPIESVPAGNLKTLVCSFFLALPFFLSPAPFSLLFCDFTNTKTSTSVNGRCFREVIGDIFKASGPVSRLLLSRGRRCSPSSCRGSTCSLVPCRKTRKHAWQRALLF